MKLKDIEEKYEVRKWKDMYLLYSKTEQGRRIVMKYIWAIKESSSTSYYVEGYKPTTKLSVLEDQIEDCLEKLPYDAEYYIPSYREGAFEELIIHDYMCDIGFKGNLHDIYSLKDNNIYGFNTADIDISFWGLNAFKGIEEEVTVLLWTGEYSWVQSKCKRNVEDIKKAIDGILKPLLITDSVTLLKKAEKLETVGDIEISVRQITNSLDIVEGDFKSVLKKQLLDMAEKL